MGKYWKFTLYRSFDEELMEHVYTAKEMPWSVCWETAEEGIERYKKYIDWRISDKIGSYYFYDQAPSPLSADEERVILPGLKRFYEDHGGETKTHGVNIFPTVADYIRFFIKYGGHVLMSTYCDITVSQ